MAAAVQTNLSVAFTHGAQLTMDHCGALIHGAAIPWSCSPSQLPQETLLLCAPISQPLTPFRWEPVNTARPARVGDTVAILFVSMLGATLKSLGFIWHFGVLWDRVAALREHAASAGYVYSTFERVDSDAHMHICSHVYSACAHTLKHMHAAALDRFSKVVPERASGWEHCVRLGVCVCVCTCDIAFLSVGIVPVVVWW